MYNYPMAQENEFKKGSLQMLILAVLSEQPNHGYAIAREIESRSRNALQAGEGALYPALRGLERTGQVVSRWEMQESGPARRIYELTDEGRGKLAAQITAWRLFSEAVETVIGKIEIGGTPHAQPI